METQNMILRKIIHLDRSKINHILEKLRKAKVEEKFASLVSSKNGGNIVQTANGLADFQNWINNVPEFKEVENNASDINLITQMKWACQAKWVYSAQIQSRLLSSQQEGCPSWISSIYKLGRYYTAALCLIKFALKRPKVFNSIVIKTVEAPDRQAIKLNDRKALTTLLKKLSQNDHDHLMSKFVHIWNKKDPEKHFQKACRGHELTVHAEMQLLNFYDHHPELKPPLLFMGTSKKACYLCFNFMSRHRLRMCVSACHQKIYPSWIPPPCSNTTLKKKQQDVVYQIIHHLEQTLKQDLRTRLGLQRPRNLDSTAGPSLSLTSSILFQLETGNTTEWVD